MTERSRRIAAIETGLSPKAIVLAWLAEAQQYEGLDTYLEAELNERPTRMPLDHLLEATIRSVEARTRGASQKDARDAREHDLRAVAFRFFLIHQSWILTHSALDRERLIYGTLACMGVLHLTDNDELPLDSPLADRSGTLRKLAVSRVTELHGLELARERISARYLDGRSILLPGMERDWAKQVHDCEELAVMAIRLAELDGRRPLEPEGLEPSEALIVRRVADHVDAAKVKTYDLLGDEVRLRKALRIWIGPSPSPVDVSTL